MTTAQRTLTINAAFLQEIKEDNRDLRCMLAECRVLLARPRGVRVDPRRLVQLLGKLRDQLALHFSLEEAYGYFDDAIDVAPRMSREAEMLKEQHPQLFVELCGVEERAEQWMYRETASVDRDELLRQFDQFHSHLQEHEAGEDALIMRAVNEEIGGGD